MGIFGYFRKKTVSRHHLRHDKTCLNCGGIVTERYCSHCGQENTEPKESLGHLIGHFFADVTHFDSQIFTTLKDLVFRPGFLTREYVAGRRLKYLNPIRMYIFISAVFFLVVFAGIEGHEGAEASEKSEHATNVFRQRFADSLRGSSSDTVRERVNREMAERLDTAKEAKGESVFFSFGTGGKIIIDLTENKYNTLREYDSIQPYLPDSSRGKGFWGWVSRKNVQKKEEHGGRSHTHVEEDLTHMIPKIMFVLLPLFAWFISWFYSRKKYYYVQHAIFSIHFHSFVFLLFLVVTLISKLITNYKAEIALVLGAYLLTLVYLVAALRGMYRQAVWMSVLKGVAVWLIYVVVILVTMWVLVMLAFLRA